MQNEQTPDINAINTDQDQILVMEGPHFWLEPISEIYLDNEQSNGFEEYLQNQEKAEVDQVL